MKLTKQFFKKVKNHSLQYFYLYTGIKLQIEITSIFNYFSLRKQLYQFNRQALPLSAKFPVTKLQAHYEDKSEDAGQLPYHYFFQDLYVAQQIFKNQPKKHVDIGSAIWGFVAHVASFREIYVYDIRPLETKITNVVFQQVDLMRPHPETINSTDSISCLHALEHFGLGRYGDPINYDGYLLGFENIYKMLQPNGKFYFSVPLGQQRVEFHAHRIFSLRYLLELIEPYYEIDSFSYIDDQNIFYENVHINPELIQSNANCKFGCALFVLTKKSS